MLATCILASESTGTRAELYAIYNNFNIGGMVYGEFFFKGPMNKANVNNKETTRYSHEEYDNLPSYMTTCDSYTAKFILKWRNIVSLIETCGVVLIDKFKIMWRAFELYKDSYFVEYTGCKQEDHEEDDIRIP